MAQTPERNARLIGQACRLYTLNGIEEASINEGNGHAIIRSTQSRTAICVNWQMVESRITEYGSNALFHAC